MKMTALRSKSSYHSPKSGCTMKVVMAMPPPGPPGGDGGGDRDDPGRRERERDYVPDTPAEEDEEEHPRSTDTTLSFKRQRLASQSSARAPGYWLRGRGRGSKQDVDTGAKGTTIVHGALSPYSKGVRPRQLFTHDQGGKSSGQSTPVLTGRGNSPEEQRRSVQIASATARANQALQNADNMNETSTDPQQVAQAVQVAAEAVNYATALQTGAMSGVPPAQAGKGSGKNRSVMQRKLEAHFAAKGKGTGKAWEPCDEGLRRR